MGKWRTATAVSVIAAVGVVLASVLSQAAGSTPPAAEATTSASDISIVNNGGACTSAFCYEPSNVTVLPGTTVTWSNKSIADHTVTRCNSTACSSKGPGSGTDPSFNSGVFATTFSLAFHGVGTYNYYCQIHGFATCTER